MQITRYRQRISGPLLDRIGLHVEVPNMDYKQMSSTAPEESSETVRSRVIACRTIQQNRYRSAGITSNSTLTSKLLRQHCVIDSEASGLLEHAIGRVIPRLGLLASCSRSPAFQAAPPALLPGDPPPDFRTTSAPLGRHRGRQWQFSCAGLPDFVTKIPCYPSPIFFTR